MIEWAQLVVLLYRETVMEDTVELALVLTVSSKAAARYSEATVTRHCNVQLFLVIVYVQST